MAEEKKKGRAGMISFCTGDQELRDRFKAYCKERGTSITFILTKYIEELLRQEEDKNGAKQRSLIRIIYLAT